MYANNHDKINLQEPLKFSRPLHIPNPSELTSSWTPYYYLHSFIKMVTPEKVPISKASCNLYLNKFLIFMFLYLAFLA